MKEKRKLPVDCQVLVVELEAIFFCLIRREGGEMRDISTDVQRNQAEKGTAQPCNLWCLMGIAWAVRRLYPDVWRKPDIQTALG